MFSNPYYSPAAGYGAGYPYQAPQMGAFSSAMMQPGMMQNAAQTATQTQFSPLQETKITAALVPTVDQVERVQMLPGERKIILVQNDPNFLAIRVADNAGFVSTEYRTSQVIDPKTAAQQVQYAPVQAVLELKSEVDELKKMIGGTANAKSADEPVSGAK